MKTPKKNIKKSNIKKAPSGGSNSAVAGAGGIESAKRFNDEEEDEFDLPIDELDGFDELESFDDEEDY